MSLVSNFAIISSSLSNFDLEHHNYYKREQIHRAKSNDKIKHKHICEDFITKSKIIIIIIIPTKVSECKHRRIYIGIDIIPPRGIV